MQCKSCDNLSGRHPLFPESRIYDGKYWVIEHVYPVKIKGWFVIILKKHKEALHELSQDEFEELKYLIFKLTKLLYQKIKCKKEYVICLAEQKFFHHIHFHIIARPHNLHKDFKGPRIFKLLNCPESDSIAKEKIVQFCRKIHFN